MEQRRLSLRVQSEEMGAATQTVADVTFRNVSVMDSRRGKRERVKRVTMHFRDKYKWDKGWCESRFTNLWAEPEQTWVCTPSLSLPLQLFSSMGCEGPRVPVLITDERCRAWTPGLTSQHDSLRDYFSPDGIAWLALRPQIKSSARSSESVWTCMCVCFEPCGRQVVKSYSAPPEVLSSLR